MKLVMPLLVIVVLLGSQLLPVVPLGGIYNPTVPEPSAREPSGMPGWPYPAKPIPHHEPGHLSRAESYTTQVVRPNELGVPETIEISGGDAMVADGTDPLVANYTMVDLDQIMMSWYASDQTSLQTFTSTLDIIPGSEWSLGNYRSVDIAAGDLNRDGQDEQIVAWMDPTTLKISMAIGEMPGSLGRTTSAPAAVAGSTAQPDGWALQFDGVDDYVNAGTGINLAGASFTVAFWAKRDTVGTDDFAVGHGTGPTNLGLHLGFLGSNNKFRCSFHANDLDTPEVYTDTNWHHWACTYDADTNLRTIYRDGVQVAQDTAAADYQGSGELDIGRYLAASRSFDGLIDEVGIWEVARTPDRIQADLIRLAPDEAGLVAYWRFDEGAGTTAVDASGHGHDGTLVNGPQWNEANAPLGELHLLVRGYDEALWHCLYDADSGHCLNWNNSAGGTLLSAPAIASQGDGQFDVFVIGTDNQVYRRHWDAGWSGDWQLYADWPDPAPSWTGPTPELPSPAAVARNGGVDLFRLGPDNTLRWHDGTGWQSLGGMLASGPGVVSWGPDHMQVFARGADDALWYRTYNADSWEPWQQLELDGMPEGVTIAAAPTAVSPGSGQIRVYVQGSDNVPYWIDYAGGSWGSWIQGSGQLASALGAAWVNDQCELFARQDDGGLQHSADGLVWTPSGGLNPFCAWFDTGLDGVVREKDPFVNASVDVETGYFLGDGRAQIVVAYALPDQHAGIALFGVGGGFTPWLVTPPLEVDQHAIEWLSIATGDFLDADGIDEVALAYVRGGNRYGVDIIRLTGGSPGIVLSHEELENTACGYGSMGFVGTLEVASGDLDRDGGDEIAMTTVFSCLDWETLYHCTTYRYNFHNRIFDILHTPDPDPYLLLTFRIGTGLATLEGWRKVDQWHVGLALAAGDLQGDGKDELIRTWPVRFGGALICFLDGYLPLQDQFVRKLQIFQLPTNPDPYTNTWDSNSDGVIDTPGEQVLTAEEGPTWNSYRDRLAVGDLDLDLAEEAVWHIGRQADRILRTYDYDPALPPPHFQPHDGPSTAQAGYPNLITGAFSGDSMRVGPPTYRVQTKMASPVVFLNLPPMHQDIITVAGEEQVIEVNNGATAVHTKDQDEQDIYASVSKRDWQLSTGFDMSVGAGGYTVKTSLENTYGENFSRSAEEITARHITDQSTADLYDQLIYNSTNYAVLEYPVYGVHDGIPGEAQTIAVAWPLVDITNLPATRTGNWCDEYFYAPGHQPYNIWSYDPISLDTGGFEDYDTLILSKQTTGGTTTTFRMEENASVTRSASFHNQVSAGLEFGYENELDIPVIGKAFDFSFRAKANGSYGHENISTFTSDVAEKSGVDVSIPSDPYLPVIEAYLYWSTAEYLVLDYQTEPGSGVPWSYYNKPDPAFILPWYGFPDPEDPVPPPCGNEKQLFTHEIELDPAYVKNGDTVIMTATVRNFSSANPSPSKPVVVRFYLGYPGADNDIGECAIPASLMDRDLGPQQCSDTWVVTGGLGKEQIYAVIDPDSAFDEMHDEDDVIDNNIGYALLHVASADYFDPGLRQVQLYEGVLHIDPPGLGFGLYLPTTNLIETVRYELLPLSLGELPIVGYPIQVLAYRGGQKDPQEGHIFGPIPAAMMALYRDGDLLPGMDEGNLILYRQDGSDWVDATCPGYEVIRFPADNRVAVPICQTGVFALSDETQWIKFHVYLPLVMRGAP